jgi:hypothetical protein
MRPSNKTDNSSDITKDIDAAGLFGATGNWVARSMWPFPLDVGELTSLEVLLSKLRFLLFRAWHPVGRTSSFSTDAVERTKETLLLSRCCAAGGVESNNGKNIAGLFFKCKL